MTKFDHNDGNNPQHDDHEEGFVETLDRVAENWRMILLAVVIALPLAGLVIWAFNTFLIK